MAEQPLPLITFYQGWEAYQQSLVEIIAPLSSEQLALPTASLQWTIGMVAQHMVANRVWWFHGWMGEGSPDLAPIMCWDPGDNEVPPALASAELVAGLEATWHMIDQALAHWTPTDLGQVFPPPAFLSEGEKKFFGERTRQWMIWYVLQHEIHHGGELSLALGGYGPVRVFLAKGYNSISQAARRVPSEMRAKVTSGANDTFSAISQLASRTPSWKCCILPSKMHL